MDYDLIIIGAGWAGFSAALRAKERGLKVALVEKDKIGGTCLNYGCIPTKSLIQSAKIYNLIKKSAVFGVSLSQGKLEFNRIQSRKDALVGQLRQGMRAMLKGVDFLEDEARLISRDTVQIGGHGVTTKFILISSGSKITKLPNFKFDGQKIISSNDALELKEVPSAVMIIGAGAIGCEFTGLFSILGAKVAIAEKMPQLLPGLDKDVARKIESIFKKRGIKVMLNSDACDPAVILKDYDKLLVCIGRTANTGGLGLENAGVATEKGRIIVDDNLKTNIDNIYAAGDCASKVMLAHLAAWQGESAVNNMVSPAHQKDNQGIPNCVYTDPEIASVGINEEGAAESGIPVRIHRFDFKGCGMARILEEPEGFVKIISDKNNGRILGAAIIGPRATELIGIITLAINNSLKVSQLRDTVFAHPSLSESLSEALKDSHEIRNL